QTDVALNTLYQEIKKLQTELISDSELEKLKNQVMLNYVRGLQTVASKARALALNEILFGNYAVLFDDLDRYNAVTAEDIRRVAQTYLRPMKRTVVTIRPKGNT